MTIATLDQLIALLPGQQRNAYKFGTGIAGQYYCAAPSTGGPGALNAPAAIASNGTLYDNTSTNAYPFTNPATAGYLAKLTGACTQQATLMLYDLLWGVTWTATVTGSQAITFPTIPSRDINGAALGAGIELWYLPWATVGVTSGTITVTYTNQAGTASQATAALSPGSAGALGRAQQFTLASGDTGVRSVQNVNSSATMTSGTPAIVMMRQIAVLPLPTANVGGYLDFSQLGLPRIYSGSCLIQQLLATASSAFVTQLSTTVVDG